MFLLIDLIFWGGLLVLVNAVPPVALVAILIVLATLGNNGRH